MAEEEQTAGRDLATEVVRATATVVGLATVFAIGRRGAVNPGRGP